MSSRKLVLIKRSSLISGLHFGMFFSDARVWQWQDGVN